MGLLSTIGAASGRAFGFTRSTIAQALSDAYFNLVTLLLPGDGTNGAQNNTFLDSSTNNFTTTRNGNTTQGTFSPFSQTGWSNYLDGTSTTSIDVAANAGINDFGTGDFTIECFFYATSADFSVSPVLLSCVTTWATSVAYNLEIRTGGVVYFMAGDNVPISINSGATTVAVNTWNHIAVSRISGTTRLFVNGAQAASTSTAATITKTAQSLRLGAFSAGGGQRLTGYLSNVRIVKGQGLYTGAFTVPTEPLATTSQNATAANVSLLTCNSNRFVDNSTAAPKTVTPSNAPSVQAFSPFAPTAAYSAATNGSSGYFDGTGDWLSIASANITDFGTGQYSFEFWFYPTATSTDYRVILVSGNLRLYLNPTAYISIWNGASSVLTSSTAVRYRSWNHVQYIRTSTATNGAQIILNGVATTGTDATSWTGSSPAYIGTDGNPGTTGRHWLGYLGSFRVSSVARSSSIPSSPYESDANTKLLLNFTNAGITDATAKNDIETVGNAQISTTQSKFGGSSMYFDGTGDYLIMKENQLQAFGTGDFTIEFWLNTSDLGASSDKALIDFRPSGTNGAYPYIYIYQSKVRYYFQTADRIVQASTLSTGVWYHIAICREGSSTRMFIDGTQTSSTYTNSDSCLVGTNRPVIGANSALGANFNGYIDDLRITKGYARYTSNFTAPTTAFALQ